MADDDAFEPRLGPIGRGARRQASQIKALSRMARWGKPHLSGRARMAPGSVWALGRGKGAAAIARHWAEPGRRRVIVSVRIAPARGANAAAFASHIKYIQRDGTDRSGSRAPLFDRADDNVPARDFNSRSAGDVHQFRIIVSPEESASLDLTAFTRRLMRQVDRDLRIRTDWVAAAHYNTPQPHVHIALRGGNEREGVMIIARRYLTHGLRHRAEELATQDLGPRTWREQSAARQQEIVAERFTSIDAALKQSVIDGQLELDQPVVANRAADRIREVGRLRQLQLLGLARHIHGSRWKLAPGWTETLKALGQRNEILSGLESDLGAPSHPRTRILDLASSGGAWVTGRVTSRTRNFSGRDGEIVLVDGVDGRAWVWQASEQEAGALPRTGAVVSVQMQGQHPPVADPSPGGLSPPTIRLFVNSWLPLGELVERRAFTWLDELDEASLSNAATGFGAEVRAAKIARSAYLQSRPLDFAESENLRSAELAAAAREIEARLGKRYAELGSRETFRGEYTENLDTAYGRFAVVTGAARFTLVAVSEELAGLRGHSVNVEPDLGQFANAFARGRGVER